MQKEAKIAIITVNVVLFLCSVFLSSFCYVSLDNIQKSSDRAKSYHDMGNQSFLKSMKRYEEVSAMIKDATEKYKDATKRLQESRETLMKAKALNERATLKRDK